MDSSHFVLLTGIAVELPQDTTDELDSFKLLFGDDIIDYNVAEKKRERDIACNARRTKKDCWWSSQRDCACIVQISLLSSLSQWTLITLEHRERVKVLSQQLNMKTIKYGKKDCLIFAISSVGQSISQLDQVKWTNEISSELKKINYIFPKLNLRGYLGKIFGTEHLPQQFWRSNDFCILTFWCKLWRREFWNSPWHISNWKSQVKTSTNTAFYVIKYFLSIFVCLMLLLMEFIWFLMVFEGFWQ